MPRNALTSLRPHASQPAITEPSADGKIVPIRLAVLPRHRTYLHGWLQAGARMGLCDADVAHGVAEVYVWVRENADPAYAIKGIGLRWVVFDHLRNRKLGTFSSFEAALTCIRPVVPSDPIAA